MTRTEKINLSATIIGPVIIIGMLGWVTWSFNARMTIERQAEDKYNADNYVTIKRFDDSRDETNRRLENLSVEVSAIHNDLSTIKGELKTSVRTKE